MTWMILLNSITILLYYDIIICSYIYILNYYIYICYVVYISVYVCANELSLDQRAVMNMRYKCGYESYIGTTLYIVRRGVFGELL